MTITVERECDGPPVTTLTGTVDQAALLGLLRRLYSLGPPLISVICVETDAASRSGPVPASSNIPREKVTNDDRKEVR